MRNCNYQLSLPLSLVVVMISYHLTATVVFGGSYSTVTVTKKESPPGQKAVSTISIPSVPEFPKIVSRPGKNPNSISYPNPNNHNNNHNNNNNNQQQQPHQSQQYQPQQHQSYQQQATPLQQPQGQVAPSSVHLQNAGPAGPPQQQQQQQQQQLLSLQEAFDKQSPGVVEGGKDYQQQYLNFQESFLGNMNKGKGQLGMGGPQSSHSKNESTTTMLLSKEPTPTVTSEKFQDQSSDFNMPLQVMNILNALGTGGSLAQASKPEKDGTGFTTANAIGYATGDNATVSATVSNKMEVNTQTVILTESASASASSTSNGTAFSQATLQSNGYANNLGGWPAGPGWSS